MIAACARISHVFQVQGDIDGMSTPVTYSVSDGVARIAMDDGKVNVMSLAMLQSLHDAFDRAARDQAMVIFSSARDGIFSAGFDLKVFAAKDVAGSVAMVRAGAELALKLLTFPRPVLSICTGHAYPMGAFLLLSSDLRVGTLGNYKVGFNEVAIGIPIPSFALELGRARMHPAWLSRAATTGEMFGPQDARRAGYLDIVVPAQALDETVRSCVEVLRKVHQPSHAAVKQRLHGATVELVRSRIESELTVDAFRERERSRADVTLPGTP